MPAQPRPVNPPPPTKRSKDEVHPTLGVGVCPHVFLFATCDNFVTFNTKMKSVVIYIALPCFCIFPSHLLHIFHVGIDCFW